MKTILLWGGTETNKSVGILTQHLTNLEYKVTRSINDPHDVTVCWGSSLNGPNVLNGKVNSFNKLQAFDVFREAEIACPVTYPITEWHRAGVFPRLARKIAHKQGRDIVVCKTVEAAGRIHKAYTHDFFSEFIPTQTEYRVWIFGKKAFAVYEKAWKGEGEFVGFRRNHRFGFRFEKHDELRTHKLLCSPAIKAVEALHMEFGAVDILLGKDLRYYVLEVNSMPAIDSIEKSNGIRLAARISDWATAQ